MVPSVAWFELADAGAVARVRRVARATRRIAAGRPRRLEPVVVADPGEAGVLIDALRACIAAARPVGRVVGLAYSGAVAGIRGVARTTRWIAAGRPRRLEPVVVAYPSEAGVLIHALRTRVAAAGPVRRVVDLAYSGPVARVRRVARTTRRIAAGRARRLVSVVVTGTREAGVLDVALVPASPQFVPSAAWLTWHTPDPLQVSAASHALLDGSPHAVPAGLNPLSWQTPARQVSWFTHSVPASPQLVPSAAWLAWHAPDPSHVSAASHTPLDGSPHAVPAGRLSWTQLPAWQLSVVHTLLSSQFVAQTLSSPPLRHVVIAPSSMRPFRK